MNIHDELFFVSEALNSANIDYAVCGGLAGAIHGFPRATRDIDILILEKDWKMASSLLEGIGYNLLSGVIPLDVGTVTERNVLRATKNDGKDYLTIELIFVAEFLEDIWATREKYRVEDTKEVWVVSAEGWATMKRLSGMLQDQEDLSELGFEEDWE